MRHHVLPATDHALLHQVHQAGGNLLCRLLFVAGQIAGLRQWAAVGRVVRVAQPQPVIGQGLPGVDAGTVGAVKVGLQAFAALQFDVRDDKIQLKPSLVAVLYPQAGVLVAVEASQQRVLPFIHQARFLRVCNVRFLE
ncbi:hypothetical protein ENINMA194M_22410 [Enterobacter intestinihominis]